MMKGVTKYIELHIDGINVQFEYDVDSESKNKMVAYTHRHNENKEEFCIITPDDAREISEFFSSYHYSEMESDKE